MAELRDRYHGATTSGMESSRSAAEAISELLEPMQERRQYESDDVVMDILHDGRKAIAATEETLALAKEAASLRFFDRAINL